jgi:hypothetical protein
MYIFLFYRILQKSIIRRLSIVILDVFVKFVLIDEHLLDFFVVQIDSVVEHGVSVVIDCIWITTEAYQLNQCACLELTVQRKQERTNAQTIPVIRSQFFFSNKLYQPLWIIRLAYFFIQLFNPEFLVI